MQWNLPALLPSVSIGVALAVFLAREWLESRRRRQATTRKLGAIRVVLARECELNNWSVSSLRRILLTIRAHWGSGKFSLEYRLNLPPIFYAQLESKEFSSSPIPQFYQNVCRELLLPVAELDARLLGKLESSITELAEMDHVATSLCAYLEYDDGHFEAFLDYALRATDSVRDALNELYKDCTGQLLTKSRVR